MINNKSRKEKENLVKEELKEINILELTRTPVTHSLKCSSITFEIKLKGLKDWEYRINDRFFFVGDYLEIKEYIKGKEEYTGRSILEEVVYILYGPEYDIPLGYCILSTKQIKNGKE